MTKTSTAPAPGISATEHHHLVQGARESFARQDPGVLTEFIRRTGTDPLSGDLRALTAPADLPGPPPGAGTAYTKPGANDPHFMW
jgi:hypothetical protein